MTRVSSSVFALVACLALVACGDAGPDFDDHSYINIMSGEACSPNPLTFVPLDANGQSNGNVSPTGIPGDNMDDLRSGKVDCLGDGNSGQGDDRKHPWCGGEPPPGCDDEGCCDDDCSEDDPEDEPADPPAEDPPAEDPPEQPAEDPQEDPTDPDPPL